MVCVCVVGVGNGLGGGAGGGWVGGWGGGGSTAAHASNAHLDQRVSASEVPSASLQLRVCVCLGVLVVEGETVGNATLVVANVLTCNFLSQLLSHGEGWGFTRRGGRGVTHGGRSGRPQ